MKYPSTDVSAWDAHTMSLAARVRTYWDTVICHRLDGSIVPLWASTALEIEQHQKRYGPEFLPSAFSEPRLPNGLKRKPLSEISRTRSSTRSRRKIALDRTLNSRRRRRPLAVGSPAGV